MRSDIINAVIRLNLIKRVKGMKIAKSNFELAMANACITAEELSKITGISSITITRIKNGIQDARPATVGKIARALNVDVGELIDTEAATSNQLNRDSENNR